MKIFIEDHISGGMVCAILLKTFGSYQPDGSAHYSQAMVRVTQPYHEWSGRTFTVATSTAWTRAHKTIWGKRIKTRGEPLATVLAALKMPIGEVRA